MAGGAPGEVVLAERSSHHIPRDRPDAVAQAIRQFLAFLPASRSPPPVDRALYRDSNTKQIRKPRWR